LGPVAGRTAFLALVLLLAVPTGVRAQELDGVVMRRDSTVVPGVMVELHRVTETSGALHDSTRADDDGRFSFSLTDAEGGALFVAGARHEGVLYWGPPVHATVQPELEDYPVFVFDTAAVDSPVSDLRLAIRHVVLTPTASAIQVEEIIDIGGQPDRTLVPASDSAIVWSGALATGARGVVVVSGGVPEEDVLVFEKAVGFRGALPPTGIRLAVQYFVPSLDYEFTAEQPTDRLEVLAMPGPGTVFRVSGLTEAPTGGTMPVPVRRFTASDLQAGDVVTVGVSFEEPSRGRAWIWLLVALALGTAAIVSVRLNARAA
jgi:hypothetical protein